jgi:3'-phosphoadenosine 5'-phosphosulfate sulfotransferase (PAPS reductase)/FAD synthetase
MTATNSIPNTSVEVEEVVEHVKRMEEKYGFKSDEDSVAGAVEESAELLRMELTQEQVAQACSMILER